MIRQVEKQDKEAWYDYAAGEKDRSEKNAFTLDGIGAGGTVTLHEDNSVELDFGNVHYIGYVTPTEYAQNYHLRV